jgi:hypothetical protein
MAAAAIMTVARKKTTMTKGQEDDYDNPGLGEGCTLLTRWTREATTIIMALLVVQTLLMMMSQ